MQLSLIKSKLATCALIALAGLYISTPALALEVGVQASDFELSSAQGGTMKFSSAQGKVVYLDFWASWCGPCRESFPWMNAMHEKYKEKGLQVIAINLDANSKDATKFLTEHEAKFTVLFDPKGVTPGQYKVKGMPSSFLISRDGKVLVQHMGFNHADSAELEKKIQAALGDKK